MLFYMSLLNLLSDWTCYSVAPISLLAEEAFGNIDPERLVVVFLGANALGTACEPIILARLGLRRTVLLGSLLLMIGSIVKSGGLPPIIPISLDKGHSEWSLYVGFFIVGLSQPLYQCTPALLSASWFPEEERTMATGVALNANQLGIGFAFIFGTLLVSKSDDIPAYFGLLSQISTLVFIGTLIQFDDAPPTPPSSSAKVVKGVNFKMSVIRSLHACMIRPGFSHALAAFTVSGIVINTLSTYMDYLVRLNGAPRTYTGIVGGAFQFIIMISSLIMGKQTDKTRAYYSVIIGMLVLGAFGLAECGVSLDSDRGGDLRWSLLLVAVLVGPLQPISTELGVEVAYPLSENTVLVIQQLFSNLLSAIFIPFFKSLKSIGTRSISDDGDIITRPDFTFSFYLLIVIHTLVTVYFATFSGKYLRYEHELQKKAEEDQLEAERDGDAEADETGHGGFVHPFHANNQFSYYPPQQQQQQPYDQERQPLMQNI
ncbi:MFS general substrate transporter [Fragilariopsis cylindrus CCMP1102]|uniref:MFS general substrate transporter n=1 Tax=Fragilariopsis cylindrus CCMP1102 TaxID=635003 RepID=A0A1E7F3J6_9STRA|nr:MFS general substrate transporter [Fragilariopsis cylindrus CCMP1102]|eukprot:OEU12706.1 MFS general substrate transporter [Fragilariopsis cylindrus CCMP1102]